MTPKELKDKDEMIEALKKQLEFHRKIYPHCSKACFCWDVELLIEEKYGKENRIKTSKN